MKKETTVKEQSELKYTESLSTQEKSIQDLTKTWKEDTEWKLKKRKFFAFAFPIFLLVQNLFVYGVVWYAYFKGIEGVKIADIQILLSVLITGTIGQTIMIIKIMVQWIFSDIRYTDHPLFNNQNK